MKMAALVLAAGAASRFGSIKQLAIIDGAPMLQCSIDNAKAFLPNKVFAVLGSDAEKIKPEISGCDFLINHQWDRGLGSSISFGVSYLKHDFDAVLIMLGDQPKVGVHYLEDLGKLFVGEQVVCSRYRDGIGVPAIFGSHYFDLLMNLSADIGARALIRSIDPIPKSLSLRGMEYDVDYPHDLDGFYSETR
jgi:molybdenum cofactor cytidylyltransferase